MRSSPPSTTTIHKKKIKLWNIFIRTAVLDLNMCVKCTRCSRPFYCQARMIEAKRDYWLSKQQVLDVGIKIESVLYPEDCDYNYSTVVSCTMCQPNSTAHQDVEWMGRKRVSNPRISFSISVDSHLLNKLNMRIGYNQSRSRWISEAIRSRLSNEDEGADAVGKASMAEILSEMNWRATHPSFKSMFTKGDREKIVLWQQKAKELMESGENQ